ncbi:neurogenic protein big brain isoform X1 [Ixodes scapularis]|nr:neurogenic protein big brain isoform X1 [Ixodes scapularis]
MAATVSLETLFLQLLGRLESTGRCPVASGTVLSPSAAKQRRSLRVEIRTLELWRAVIGECLATFFYVFLVCGAHVSWPGYAEPSVLGIALTAGAAAATLCQCYGHISGCHMNPAVTLATFATRKVSPLRALLYVTAQCGGAIAGAALLYGVTVPGHQSSLGSSRPHEALGAWQAFGVEFVLSFLLASTVFASRDPSRSHLGGDAVVIGFAYLACTLAGLPATGASMNPARSLGPAFVMNKWIDHWVYWFGPVAGGLLAGLIYEYIFDTKKGSRALKQSLEDADKESNTDDDYEDPDAKITKYATVAQSPKGGVSGHQQCRGAQQQQQYEAAAGFRPAANTYSPTPSSAFPAATDTYGGSHAAAGTYAAPIYDLEMPSGHFRRAWSTDKDLDLQNSKLYI